MSAPVPKPKHVPERTCVACRKKRPQAELLRFSKGSDGVWGMDGWLVRPKVRTGRGVYLCGDSPECWKEKRLRRTFGAQAAKVATTLEGLSEL